VKINYDTANAIFYGDVDVVQDMEAVIDDIAYIHLKDKAGPKDVWNFPALGEGYVDFENIFKLLKNRQNDAPLSIEIEFTERGPRDADEVDAALVTSANYLKSLGIPI
ncbi:MAG: sugar phosphate isomerase/epimerase, partial [Clostridiales bacterium]|nr:sugar phosphate isomerase/epimerase [Clostridiales bacterium]